MNTPVNFEIAKVLKYKGYCDDNCKQVYYTDFEDGFEPDVIEVSERMLESPEIGEFDYLAPTIAEVCMWLYEKHEIWISVIHRGNFSSFHAEIKKAVIDGNFLHGTDTFGSPTEAYEAAIEYVLKNLIK